MMNSLNGFARVLLAAALWCGMAGCATSGEPAVRGGSYALAEHQSVALGAAVSLHYDRFADSRCPPTVKCIWAGKTSYQFTLGSHAGSESFTLDKEGDRYNSNALQGVSVVLAHTAVPDRKPAEHAIVVDIVVK
jgi:hypothetical protein